mgnify:CR=1 FL=1
MHEHHHVKISEKIHKIEEKIDLKLLPFKIFVDPRPKYIAKVTIIDRVIDVLLLWAFPEKVRPNYITLFRFISIPFIVYLLLSGHYLAATISFGISAISDAVDGAIARTRNMITDWGIFFDPFADKLLVGIVGGTAIFKFLSPALALTLISIELALMASAYFRFKGEVVPAKTVGKIKMNMECFGVGFIFLFLVSGFSPFLIVATCLLYLGVLFALLSLLIYRSI